MKIINYISVILILGSLFNLFLFRIVPLGNISLIVLFMIGFVALAINMQYLDKKDKIKKGKQL